MNNVKNEVMIAYLKMRLDHQVRVGFVKQVQADRVLARVIREAKKGRRE